MKIARLIIPLPLTLAACGSPNDPGVGGVTKQEAEQLNEAAEMLNRDAPPPRLTKDAPAPVPASNKAK